MIIDFRLRPPTPEFAATQMFAINVLDRHHRLVGTMPPEGPRSAHERSVDLLLEEMGEAGITVGVACGRHRPGTEIPNPALRRIMDDYPGRFCSLGSVDVLDETRAHAMIDEALGDFGFPGIHLDLGVLGLTADATSLYPFYEHVHSLGGFVAINTSALGAQEQFLCNPEQIDRAARDFPELTFVSSHGSYPYVLQIIAVAAKRPNLYISPDMYMTNMPGGSLYAEAANTFLQDQTLFGTGYPYTNLKDTVDRFMAIPFSDEAREKILCRNAQTLLRL